MTKHPFYQHRVFNTDFDGADNGLRQEVVSLHASTAAGLREAEAFYRRVTRAGMTTLERINRAIHLHEAFDAEARHSFV